ncbi:hypothetical protein Goshw_001385 [Gossypium schwendimanii]|uniref:Uncharacterized protein n=1 Tax=Gossypium schwendimanii TaxID=34291 RepID=A0A7J9MFW5_GOSSC|nr:hypothetical protein [Gossypium schwendimanii]
MLIFGMMLGSLDKAMDEYKVMILMLVRELFDEELVERVLCIPIGRSQVADEMIWRYESYEEYTSTSGYRLLLEKLQQKKGCYATTLRVNLVEQCIYLRSDHNTWLAEVVMIYDEKTLKLIAISYWAIWYAKNKIVHEGVRQSVQELIVFIKASPSELEAVD